MPRDSGANDDADMSAALEGAFDRITYFLDRGFEPSFRVNAFIRAREVVRNTDIDELRARAEARTLKELPGIGDVTADIISSVLVGVEPPYLTKLATKTQIAMSEGARAVRAALRGDLHSHSDWSDGGAPIATMARTAKGLGHAYWALTDHSGRLTIAHGLDRDRWLEQREIVGALNAELAPFRILTGMEVDINEDGTLDCDEDLLAEMDVVVASVHSKLRMEARAMTERMVLAVANPHVDVLGHCTGRLIGKRPESKFDPDIVFAACARFGTAVEINCRPERLDPPRELLGVAIDYGCLFSIDTDAHAPGQLEWQPHGCERAAETEVPVDRVINTWPVEQLLDWTGSHPG